MFSVYVFRLRTSRYVGSVYSFRHLTESRLDVGSQCEDLIRLCCSISTVGNLSLAMNHSRHIYLPMWRDRSRIPFLCVSPLSSFARPSTPIVSVRSSRSIVFVRILIIRNCLIRHCPCNPPCMMIDLIVHHCTYTSACVSRDVKARLLRSPRGPLIDVFVL